MQPEKSGRATPRTAFDWAVALLSAAVIAAGPATGSELPPLRPMDRDGLARASVTWLGPAAGQPVAFAAPIGGEAGEGWVVEKEGQVRALGAGRLATRPVLDLRGDVSAGAEQGLLGLAFHPGFLRNGRFFTNQTDPEGHTVITAWRLDRPTAWLATAEGMPVVRGRRTLLKVRQPFPNHNGGHLAFGPDGRLYIGMGDGGGAYDPLGTAQAPQSLLGKLLALDVDAPEARPTIVASGLRNPWSFVFDRRNGDCWVADVGQNRWEEVNRVPFAVLQGSNFGWSRVEGRGHCLGFRRPCDDPSFVRPAWEYGHEAGCSVSGGVLYRGKALPWLQGRYLFSDYCSGFLHVLTQAGGRIVEAEDATPWLAGSPGRITALAEDGAGEIVILSQAGNIGTLLPRRNLAQPRKTKP